MTEHDQRQESTAGVVSSALARLEAQSRLADELAELARGQAELIADGEADELLSVLERRQQLIDELIAVADEVAPLAASIEHKPDGATPHQRESVQALVDSISGRLAEVIEIDSADRTRLQKRMGEIRKEIDRNGTARIARRAYGAAESGGGPLHGSDTKFTDQKG